MGIASAAQLCRPGRFGQVGLDAVDAADPRLKVGAAVAVWEPVSFDSPATIQQNAGGERER